MNYNFYLIDDDVSVISMLSKIIVNQKLGDVIGRDLQGDRALSEIRQLRPDIVIVDFLLPKSDGIELVLSIKREFKDLPIVMISEVSSKDMISKAYDSGIEYYINKPINVIEVFNVLKRIDENLKLKKVVNMFQSAIDNMQSITGQDPNHISSSDQTPIENAKEILSHLGIISYSGSKDILCILEYLQGFEDGVKKKVLDYRLSELYTYVSDRYKNENKEIVNEKTIEQRIRRAINQALETIGIMGLDDYENIYFERFSSSLFEFTEVRKHMEFIKNKRKTPGKINIKKFISGLVAETGR